MVVMTCKRYGGWAVVVLLVAAACNEPPTAPSRQDLNGRWVVSSLQPANAAAITPQGSVALAMEFADERVSVQSDCNTCAGAYTLNGAAISMPNLACTRRACIGPSHEDMFLDLISGAEAADVVPGESLVLSGQRGRIVLRR
jgi:heat shock protein HslJ